MIRNMAKVKLLRKRPEHLVLDQSKFEKQGREQDEEEEDYSFIDLRGAGNNIHLQHEEVQGQPELAAAEEVGAAVQAQAAAQATPRGRSGW